jgi:hypothetical protein
MASDKGRDKDNDGDRDQSREDADEGGGISLSETLKKVIAAGVGAAFMTEESIRGYLSELKLPKEVLNIVLQGAAKSKEELVTRVGNEIIKIINRIDMVKEASRFVEEHKFKIMAEVEVVKRDATKGEPATEIKITPKT